MKHESLAEIRQVADIFSLGRDVPRLSHRERLERWAAVLDQHEGQVVPLVRIEDYAPRERDNLRGDKTPLSVAFSDPILRADGLLSDRLGDAVGFFGLGHAEAHRLLCDCHYRGTMTAPKVAARLRAIARGGIMQRIWDWTTRRVAAG
ncbi:hypothetical protein [Phreatobacter stygius]|uniref:Uncharacterized protein n=1 Tax=Phreatobacter stygius TaxID=1940610 RepID=A0A4D7B3Y5_9HYPH|nr:hypothetical protein [Phreatobacter stygius]QCI65248.1 hypothetical protein E8M01_14140 [Phreatobacter stygius]